MDMVLRRIEFQKDGIFGTLFSPTGFSCMTLEHAYAANGHGFLPKIAPGTYVCQRGIHTLLHHPRPFEAFEILDVPPFQNLPVTKCLFHIGNFNMDSNGCVLVGSSVIVGQKNGIQMISDSIETFDALMLAQKGVDRCQLIIEQD